MAPNRQTGAPILIAATTAPCRSRIGAARQATPISRSLIASAQPRARTVASARAQRVRVGDRVRGEAGQRTAGQEAPRAGLGQVRQQHLAAEHVQCAGTRRPVSVNSRSE